MKKKTYIKEGAYQKVTNTPSKKIKGALDFNKEVLDTLVDKSVIGTTDCCKYFLTATTVLENEFESLYDAKAFPPNSFISVVDQEGNSQGLYFTFLSGGELAFGSITINL